MRQEIDGPQDEQPEFVSCGQILQDEEKEKLNTVQIRSDESLSRVQLFSTP